MVTLLPLLLVLCPQQITDVQGLRDPAPGANQINRPHQRHYDEMTAAGRGSVVRPGSGGRPALGEWYWARYALADHLIRLKGKGGLPFNPRGRTFSWTWNQLYAFNVNPNIKWRLPEFRTTPGPVPGVTYGWDYWDRVMQAKLTFGWWKWLKATGVFHPKCLPGNPWEGRCVTSLLREMSESPYLGPVDVALLDVVIMHDLRAGWGREAW